jgi:hypothetical protein
VRRHAESHRSLAPGEPAVVGREARRGRSQEELLARRGLDLDGGPVWLRDYSDASSSGIGSIQVTEPEEAYAWAYVNPEISSYMVAEHLPGRNIACTLLFHEDELLKAGCYERLADRARRLVVEHRSPRVQILARTPFALFRSTYKGETGGWKPAE